jgi:glycosyltransferase involved in cell wall biosynthesis
LRTPTLRINVHVALFSPSWPLAQFPNGIVTYVHWMREELRRQGHQVSILTCMLGKPEADVHLIQASRWRTMVDKLLSRVPGLRRSPFNLTAATSATLRKIHRYQPIDVLEMEESFGWAADIARRTGLPIVVKLHGPAFLSLVDEELASASAISKIDNEGKALRQLAVLTSPARRTLDDTLARYHLAPRLAQHIVNPLQLPSDAPLWRLDGCDHMTILFVGRFDKRKGGDIVLQAYARLLVDNPDLKLIFVGPDAGVPDASGQLVHFEQMKNALLPAVAAAQVRFLGRLTPQEIYQVRPQALVTIVASRWENQSYTALEAMLQGCPIVSSDTGGQGEIIADGRSGLLCTPGSVESLATQVQVLLDDPARAAEMGRLARSYALEEHAPERVVGQTLQAYDAAIAAAGRKR